jgi:hypothetical protein
MVRLKPGNARVAQHYCGGNATVEAKERKRSTIRILLNWIRPCAGWNGIADVRLLRFDAVDRVLPKEKLLRLNAQDFAKKEN